MTTQTHSSCIVFAPTWALLVLLFAGCADRSHLTSAHGRAYSEAFSRQTVNPEPRPTDPRLIQGLDSQEASAVARTYRRGLSGKEGGDSAQPAVIMNGGAGPSTPYMPPPSVPNGQ